MTNPNQPTIGIDVGGTKIEGVLVDGAGTVLASERVPARPGNEHVVADVVTVARALSKEPLPVGIGIPGQVDSATGVVRDIVNLGIVELALGEAVSAALDAPVKVENDVNAAALGAAAALGGGPDGGEGTIVFLNLGTGVAAGIVRGGHLEHGATGSIGEIGHVPVDPNRFACACGQRGCLETVASGGAVSRLWPNANPPMPDLLARAAAGESEAMRVRDMVIHAIADTIQIAAQAYDPRLIAIGGGMAKTGAPLLDAIVAELRSREATCHFLETIDIPARLALVPGDLPVGGIGAALAVR